MINYCFGNILESKTDAIVNTVNTVGVMGKGLALQFKESFPDNYKLYRAACKTGEVSVGKMFVTEERFLDGRHLYIINFPTKKDWRNPSEYEYIESGLKSLKEEIECRNIGSIAIPPLGSRNGGLDWERVRGMIVRELGQMNCDVWIYQPSDEIYERMKKERVSLTPARAMLLDVMSDLVANGEMVSEFSAEKIAYFLQRFGAGDVFNLSFKRGVYGPYSGKVRYVMRYLNGSYIMGMSDLSKRPFDEVSLLPDIKDDVLYILNKSENVMYKQIVSKTKDFLSGYYSNYTLELLSTVDFLLCEDSSLREWKSMDRESLIGILCEDIALWNSRKQRLFNNSKYVEMMVRHIEQYM